MKGSYSEQVNFAARYLDYQNAQRGAAFCDQITEELCKLFSISQPLFRGPLKTIAGAIYEEQWGERPSLQEIRELAAEIAPDFQGSPDRLYRVISDSLEAPEPPSPGGHLTPPGKHLTFLAVNNVATSRFHREVIFLRSVSNNTLRPIIKENSPLPFWQKPGCGSW